MIQDKKGQSAKARSRRKVPLVLLWLRLSLRLQALISNNWAARRVFRLWFVSPRHPEPQREKHWCEAAVTTYIPHHDGPVATYRWGESDKTVLMLHGWSGRGAQLGAFAKPLVEMGYQVVAFDAPGHGRTPGNTSSIFRMTEALKAVVNETGPISAVITHSFGAMVLAYAMRHAGFTTGKAVCISSPTTPLFLVNRFCEVMQVDNKTRQAFMRHVESQYQTGVWDLLSADKNIKNIPLPGLVIHDENDSDVPVEYGKQLADAWSGSRFHLTKGLGHRRILRNREVIKLVTEFLSLD